MTSDRGFSCRFITVELITTSHLHAKQCVTSWLSFNNVI